MGTYHPSDMDSTGGGYILSNYRTSGTKKFVQVSPRGVNKTQMSFVPRIGKWPR